MKLSESELQAEMVKCKEDTGYFRFHWLPVVDRDTMKRVRFRLKPAQMKVLGALGRSRTVFALKPRRLGVSRAILSRLYSKCRWNSDVAAVTVMHNDGDAAALFEQCRSWERGLPEFMKQGPFKLIKDTDSVLRWKHGGEYHVVSERSLPAGGPTWWLRHYSEFAKYREPQRIIRLIEGGSAIDGKAIFETTSEGAGAYAHEMWETDNGWDKLFFPWTIDEGYAKRESELTAGDGSVETLLTTDIREYGREWNLTPEQLLWAALKLRSYGHNERNAQNAWISFHREYPMSPQLAFATALGRVFRMHYSGASPVRGRRRYADGPEPGHVYSLGLDAAGGGEDGDFSAWCVLDVTFEGKPRIVSCFYDRLPVHEFAPFVLEELKFWGLCIMVGERDEWTRGVMERVLEQNWTTAYQEVFIDKITGKVAQRLGITQGKPANAEATRWLQEYLNGCMLEPIDPALQWEINSFMWQPDGQARATRPYHDDLLRATANALRGSTQIDVVRQQEVRRRPLTLEDRLKERLRPDWNPEQPVVYEQDDFADLDDGVGGGLMDLQAMMGRSR